MAIELPDGRSEPNDVLEALRLRAVHARPGHGWTVADLAAEAAMSRSAFFARFTRVVGLPPMENSAVGPKSAALNVAAASMSAASWFASACVMLPDTPTESLQAATARTRTALPSRYDCLSMSTPCGRGLRV